MSSSPTPVRRAMAASSRRSAPMIPSSPTRTSASTLVTERAQHWLSVGAQPTDRVARFFDAAGLLKREARNNPEKAVPGKKATERVEAKVKAEADKVAAAEAAKRQGRGDKAEAAAAEAARTLRPKKRRPKKLLLRVSRGCNGRQKPAAHGPHRRGPWDQGRGAHPVLHRGPAGARRLWPDADQQAGSDHPRSLRRGPPPMCWWPGSRA